MKRKSNSWCPRNFRKPWRLNRKPRKHWKSAKIRNYKALLPILLEHLVMMTVVRMPMNLEMTLLAAVWIQMKVLMIWRLQRLRNSKTTQT